MVPQPIAIHSETVGYAVMANYKLFSPTLFLVQFNPKLGVVTNHFSFDTSGVVDVALNNGGELYIADKNVKGLRILDAATGKLLTAPLPTSGKGLAPLFIRTVAPTP